MYMVHKIIENNEAGESSEKPLTEMLYSDNRKILCNLAIYLIEHRCHMEHIIVCLVNPLFLT